MDPLTAQFLEQRLAAFMREVTQRMAAEGGGSPAKAILETLFEKITRLEQDLAARQTPFNMFQPQVFLVKKTGGKQWKEQTVLDGQVADFIDGRAATSDEDPTALIEPTSEFVAVMEIPDGQKMRCVVIGGGSERIGQFQYMVHAMVAQNVDGWDDVRGAPER